jgi:colanic acid/amylovoran biosynthesis glycosyltransferase
MNKKLFFFTASFPYGTGEQFIETEIKYLSKYFNEIEIIPYSYGQNTVERVIPHNVKCCLPIMEISKTTVLLKEIFNCSPIVPFLKELFRKKYYQSPLGLKNFILFSLRTRKMLSNNNIKRLLKEAYQDSVFYFYWGTLSSAIIPFIKHIPISKVVRFHGGDLYEYLPENYYKIFFRKELLQNISYAIFISEYGKNYLVNKYANVNFKYKIFRLGVEDNDFTELSNDGILRILSVSNLVKIKRLHLIAEAVKSIKINIEWTHIGNGPLLNEIKNSVSNVAKNIKVNFPGLLSNKEVIKYYNSNKVDLFINVSESEGMPVTIMEALSSGVPVFATNVGGVSELIDEKVGRLLPADISPELLRKELEDYYILAPDEKMKLKKNAKEKWSLLSNADNMYKEFAQFLISLN